MPHLVTNDRTTTGRPCEAVAQEYRQTIMYHEETGGVQRGQTSEAGSWLPPPGALCFYLTVEKEGSNTKDEFQYENATSKIEEPPFLLCYMSEQG